MDTRTYNINLRNDYFNPVAVGLSQYDEGVVLAFNVYDGTDPAEFAAGTTAQIQGVRPSGVGFDVACTLTDNVATVSTITDMTGESGIFPVEIRFYNSGVNVGTCNFIFVIEKAAHPDGTIDADITHEQDIVDKINQILVQTTPDPTLSEPGVAADAAATGDAVVGLKEDLTEYEKYILGKENLLTSATWVENYAINAQGVPGANNDFHYTSLIPVSDGTYQFMLIGAGWSQNIRIHGYDSNGTWVKQITMYATGTSTALAYVQIVCDGVKYIRISTGKNVNAIAVILGNTIKNIIEELTANSLMAKGNISAGLDLNTGDFIHPGRWALIDIANKPENWGSPYIGTLVCFASSSDSSVYTLQVICDYYNNVYYRMSYINGSWRPWVKVPDDSTVAKAAVSLMWKNNITDASLDINKGVFVKPGIWNVTGVANMPKNWGSPSIGKLTTFSSDSDSSATTHQQIVDYNNNYYYRYSTTNGVWNDWMNLRSGLYTHRKTAFKPIFTDFKQFKNSYPIPVHTAGASGNVTALYALYDAETASGITITKTSFGKDSSGSYDIYRYQVSKNTGDKPIVLIIVGEHSNEMNSAMLGYYAYKEVVNGVLTQYLDYVDFVFVPMLSPWGYDHNSRNNYNGVNINRDFPAMWSYSTDAHNKTGDTSMSQVETQYIVDYVLANKDKIIFAVNKHDTGTISRKINGTEEDIVCYLSSNMVTDRTINNGVCSQQNAQVRATDSWIINDCIGMDISADNLIPSVSYQLPGSMDLFFNSVGIHASLLEVSYRAYDGSDVTPRYNAPHDADLRRLGLDFFINYLASTLEHCDLLLSNDETVQQTQRYFSRKQVDGTWQNIELAFNRYNNTFSEM